MDIYFKKEINYKFEGKNFIFEVGETLFSTFNIDHGTDILIRSLPVFSNPQKILDLGCGYGPLGIILASKYPQAKITMIDRDLLAARYAKINIEKNNLKNAEALGSVGLEAVSNQLFDLVVSNIPAKIGDEAIIQEFILKPYTSLKPKGELWIVIVNALNRLIPRIEKQNNLKLKEVRKRKGHTVYKIRRD
jgi:16S rRNA (guanine1207-N2)-methyltransferase